MNWDDKVKAELEAKIKAVNNAHKLIPELYKLLSTTFKPFINQKVLKQDGSFLAKIEKLLPELPNTVPLSVNRNYYSYCLSWRIRTHETVRTFNGDYEYNLYIADTHDGVITTIAPEPTNYRSDYTIEEIENQRSFAPKVSR